MCVSRILRINLVLLFVVLLCATPLRAQIRNDSLFVVDHGAIIRGNSATKSVALVFTGDEFADGAETIAQTLRDRGVKASFFFTGRFYRNPQFKSVIVRLKREGHYLGAHSDEHLLYCDWNNRDQLLVNRERFEDDLNQNFKAMASFGIRKNDARFFLPPFEWYNQTISDWTVAMDLQLVNFTPGTRSNADYTTPEMKNYVDSNTIIGSIKDYGTRDPQGLNGFILLSHIGVAPARTDKFYNRLNELIAFLKSKKYQLVRIDQLLKT